MEYILFIVYLLIFCWLLTKVRFVKNSGLSNKYILLLFGAKIFAGLAIGWISIHIYSTGNDYWDVNREGWSEYQLLWSDPKEYFSNLFTSNYQQGYGGLFDSFQSFWNDLRNNIIIKMLSVCDIFSRGNYYINSLFFNFVGFLGHVAFYKIFIQIYRKQQLAVIVCCFLLPSMLYFTSGVQKDNIVFTTLGFLLYAVYQSLNKNRWTAKRLAIIFIAFIMLFLIRSYVLINLLPALTIWILVSKYKWPPLKSFIIGYIITGVLFFNVNAIVNSIDPLKTVTNKQAAFFTLPIAATQIKLDTLYPNFKSFAFNAPQAFNHLLLRPYPTELPAKSLLPINIELIIFQLCFILFLLFKRKAIPEEKDAFIIFGIFFSMTMFLFIGYIMPNLGSIVRYRSVYLPFLMAPVICRINWEKIARLIKIKK
ncbi:hypothetical protein [Ferruginibacter sp. SUN106]|uniref:hypothetical protein n=1 Tax=Ferruginibacter sp. SUN106 TaxID=2978348 RepID=UPI003D367A63